MAISPSLSSHDAARPELKYLNPLPEHNSTCQHIAEADDVPLRVSMFCDSSPETIRSMVSILQENGECVVSCGSARNVHNIQLFAAADLSMSIAPVPPSRQYSQMFVSPSRGLHTELPEGLLCVRACIRVDLDLSST